MKKRALIQGASGGIGCAFVAALLDNETSSESWEVVATCRAGTTPDLEALKTLYPDRLRLHAMDPGTPETMASVAAAESDPIDLLLNASGLLQDESVRPEKRVEALSAEALAKSFAVNAIAPMIVVQTFLPQLLAAPTCRIGNLSARVGSIGDNGLGGWYGYRASKAALNQLTRTLAVELRRRSPGSIVVALHPGTVVTALSKPFRGGTPEGDRFSPERAAKQLLDVLSQLTSADSGEFFAWDGSRIDW